MEKEVGPLCPKCGVPMVYLIEKEKNSKGEVRITRFYRCPVCGTKIIDEKLVLRPVNGKILVFSLINGEKPIVPGRVVRVPQRKPRKQIIIKKK